MSTQHDEGMGPEPTEDKPDDSKVKYILVLGPRGSGKTSFINTAPRTSHKARRDEGDEIGPCTREFYNCQKFSAHDRSFAFIDSPGFDSKVMCDEEIFLNAMTHLSSRTDSSGEPMKLTGIVYVHPQDDHLGSRTLWRNLKMLVNLIGLAYVDRVSILVRPRGQGVEGKEISKSLVKPKTPFFNLYLGTSVKNPLDRVWTFKKWTRSTLEKVLKTYISLPPEHFHAQVKRFKRRELLLCLRKSLHASYAKCCLSLDEVSDTQDQTQTQTQPQIQTQDRTQDQDQDQDQDQAQRKVLEEPVTSDQDGGESKADPESEHKEQETASQGDREKGTTPYYEDIQKLKDQLKKARDDYALLCEELQVEDNVEESRVAENLEDLNYFIERIGFSITRHIHKAQSKSDPLSSLGGVPQLGELLQRFGHIEGKSSLVQSLGGKYMELDDFFDYAVRTILCQKLFEKLFEPLHPSISDGSDSITEVYEQIRRHEPQLTAGRWRRDAFHAIDRLAVGKIGETHMKLDETLAEALIDLLKCCFTPQFAVTITQEVKADLIKLADKAEGLNRLVKGSVVYLGDFQPVIFSCGEDFQGTHMLEFEPDQRSKRTDDPETILATTALGLVKRYALGGGQDPKETVVRKAVVVSERVCTFL